MPIIIRRFDKKTGKYIEKEYKTVAERITELNADTKKIYDLTTELIEHNEGVWVVKATLLIQGRGTFTGMASEKDGSSLINDTSALENAETSSIGRALATAGYLGSEFCSADELTAALKNQGVNASEKVTKPQIDLINKLLKQLGLEAKKGAWLKKNKIEKIEDCSKETAQEAIKNLLEMQAKSKQKT